MSPTAALIQVAGFETPVLQQAIHDKDGLVGYTDFYWKLAKVVGEFDGAEKYVKPEFLRGRTASQAVVEEKNRENRIRATGFNVVRWVWADLKEPGKLEGNVGYVLPILCGIEQYVAVGQPAAIHSGSRGVTAPT